MALPDFRDDGWLPAGHHPTTWEELVVVFGGQPDFGEIAPEGTISPDGSCSMESDEARLLLNYQVCKEIYGGDLLFFSGLWGFV